MLQWRRTTAVRTPKLRWLARETSASGGLPLRGGRPPGGSGGLASPGAGTPASSAALPWFHGYRSAALRPRSPSPDGGREARRVLGGGSGNDDADASAATSDADTDGSEDGAPVAAPTMPRGGADGARLLASGE
jgi:hypothetical protein